MGYSAYLKPRQEAISEEGIEGIIDLANLKDESRAKVEARPDLIISRWLMSCITLWVLPMQVKTWCLG